MTAWPCGVLQMSDTVVVVAVVIPAIAIVTLGTVGIIVGSRRSIDFSANVAPNPHTAARLSSHGTIEVFFSYSHKDERLREKLVEALAALQRQGVIRGWHDRKITAGTKFKGKIDEHLNSAGVILLLVSPAFMASDYCYDVEMNQRWSGARRGRPASSRSSCGRPRAGIPPRSGSSWPHRPTGSL